MKVVARNFRCRFGEIDLVARCGPTAGVRRSPRPNLRPVRRRRRKHYGGEEKAPAHDRALLSRAAGRAARMPVRCRAPLRRRAGHRVDRRMRSGNDRGGRRMVNSPAHGSHHPHQRELFRKRASKAAGNGCARRTDRGRSRAHGPVPQAGRQDHELRQRRVGGRLAAFRRGDAEPLRDGAAGPRRDRAHDRLLDAHLHRERLRLRAGLLAGRCARWDRPATCCSRSRRAATRATWSRRWRRRTRARSGSSR